MAALKLTDDETVLARSTEDGQVCVLPVSASATSPSHIIRAEALKRLVLGLPVILADEIAPREVHIKAPGLRVCNARIEGALELNDATGPNGEPLPPLVLMRCFLNEPIAMSRARFRHLSFEGSRLTHLCAMDLKIEGTLDLSDVSSAQTGVTDGMMGEGQCWIELCGARIAGELRACRSRFVAGMETRAHEDMLKEPRYALNLRNGQIADGIDLYPDVTAIGGISLYLADIGGDIAAYGAELIGENAWLAKEDAKETDRHGAALDLRSARIRGLALFQPYTTHGKDTKPFSARGNLRLAGCEINGDLRLDGATIFGSVLGQDMVVKGDFYVQNFRGSKNGQRHDYCPDITGALNLHSADIGKALSLCSLTLTGTFNGNQLQVGGNLFMNARKGLDSDQAKLLPFKIGGDVFLQAATIAGHIQAYGVHFAGDVHAQRSIVGDGLFLCCLEGENECLRFRADKDLDFSLCRTSGQVVVSGAKIDGSLALSRSSAGFVGIIPHQRTHGGKTEQVQTEIGGGIELANAKIAGDVGFAGTKISGGVDLNDINIDGNLNFSPVPSDGPDGLQSLLVEFGSDVSLYGAKISGRLAVSGLICLGEFSAHSLSIGGTIFFNAANGHDKGKPKLLRNEVTGIAQFRSATIGGQFQAEGGVV